MIVMLFTIRFYSQFNRTQPELIQSIHKDMHDLVHCSGGKLTRRGRETIAEFSEDSFTFTIQFFTFIQQLVLFSDKLRKTLLGYSFIFQNTEEIGNERLFTSLTHIKQGFGIYFTEDVAENLGFLFSLEPVSKTSVYQLKAVKEVPALQLPSTQDVIDRFAKELDSSETRLKILIGNDRELLFLLSSMYVKKQYGDAHGFTISFNSLSPSLNGFIELFLQTMQDKEASHTDWTEKLSLLKAERLHDMYNGKLRCLLQEILAEWLKVYERIPVVLHISCADAVLDSLQPIAGQFLIEFLSSPLHRVHLIALDKQSVNWIDEIERHFVIVQSSNKSWYRLPVENTDVMNMRTILPAAYLFHKLSCIYSKSELPLQLERAGFSTFSIQWLYDAFNRIGLFPTNGPDYLLNPNAEKFIFDTLPSDYRQATHVLVQNRLLESMSKQELYPSLGFLSRFNEVDGIASPDLILDCLVHDVNDDYFAELDQAVQSEKLKQLVGIDLFQSVHYFIMTHHSISMGSNNEMLEVKELKIPVSIENPRINAFCHINAAIIRLVLGDLGEASDYIKHALVLLQDYKNKNGLEKVYRIFGLIELAQHRLGDGIEYLTFALDTAQQLKNVQEKAMASYYLGVAYFLQGNLPRAISFTKIAIGLFNQLEYQGWEQKSVFLLGRIYFSLGSYDKAIALFESIQETQGVLWSLKTKLYASIGNRLVIDGLVKSYKAVGVSEKTLEIELEYFLGNYETCVRLCESVLNTESETLMRITEQIDWTDGYAQIESLLFPKRDFLLRSHSCFKALSLSRLNPKDHAILSNLEAILDEIKPGLYDPYDVFYYNCYYLVVQQLDSTEIDRSTALSGAFKRLQKRASRIEDAELQRQYLTANYWNGLLCGAAKLHYLI